MFTRKRKQTSSGSLFLSWTIHNKKINCAFKACTNSGEVINTFYLSQHLSDEQPIGDRLSEALFMHYPKPQNCFNTLTVEGVFKNGPLGDIEEFMFYETLLTQDQIRTYLYDEIDRMVELHKPRFLKPKQLDDVKEMLFTRM